MKEVEQIELVRIAKSGNKEAAKALEELIRRHYSMCKCEAIKLLKDDEEAEELLQETFVKIIKGINNLIDNRTFSGWLKTSIRLNCMAYMKKKRNRKALHKEEIYDFVDSFYLANPEKYLETKKHQAEIKRVLEEIPEEKRTLFFLRYVEKLKAKEIADILDIKVRAAKSRIYKLKQHLRRRLKHCY